MKHIRSLYLIRLLLLTCFTLPLLSCSKQDDGPDTSAMYDEADRLYRKKQYTEALDAYSKVLAADTLKGFSKKALDALCRKSRIEFLTGSYSGAFQTWEAIRQHGGKELPDSLYNVTALDTGRMYAEQGRYDRAASVMASLRNPDPWQRFDEARLLFREGKLVDALRIYGELADSRNPAVAMSGLCGFLDCVLVRPVEGLDEPDKLAGRIAVMSGRVINMDAPTEVKIKALRIAAKSLQQMESQRPNASYLLFRALGIAQEKGFGRLVPILQFESNNLIVRKPETYRSVIEYFGQRDMPYAKTAALVMLARTDKLTPEERIEAYRMALTTCQHYGIPATAGDYVALEREAAGELGDLLAAGGRYIELFDATALADLLEEQRMVQAGISGFRLPSGNEAVQNEIIELNRDISGLLQRKIMMVEEATDFSLARLVNKVIREKQGRLIALIAEAAKVDKTVPERLQPQPVTLSTIRKNLRPGEALIRLFLRKQSLSTVMLVSGTEMQIVTSTVPGEQIMARFATLRQRLATAGPDPEAALAADEDRRWLTGTLLKSIDQRLAGYKKIIFVSRKAVPFHLLGNKSMLGSDHQVSWVASTGEALVYADVQPQGDATFFDASSPEKAGVYKLFHPRDQVFLSWKPMQESEISSLKTRLKPANESGASGPDSLKKNTLRAAASGNDEWAWLTPYGSE